MDDTNVFLHEDAWTKTFRGWDIVDVAVRSRNVVYVALRKCIPCDEAGAIWDHDIPSRLAVLYLDECEPDERWSHQGLTGFSFTRCAAGGVPLPQGIALSQNGDALGYGSGLNEIESVRPDDRPIVLERGRCIAGRPYAVGMLRSVFRRVEVGHWEQLADGLPKINRTDVDLNEAVNIGFRDIDGFAEHDIYAVGGNGDVWHYDGQRWNRRKFHSKVPLYTVCCAGDQQVYISGEAGTIFRGRHDAWCTVWKAESSLPYNDARWFDGKLWLASDYVLDQFIDGRVERARHYDERVHARGHMDVADGVLVIASLENVQIYDGQEWRMLVQPYP
jgi:hypothetical protein